MLGAAAPGRAKQGSANQTKARILARAGVARRSAAGIGRVWQGKDFSAAGPGSAGHGTAAKGKDFSADRPGTAGLG